MRLLVLGGTRFVGRAIVTDALARGIEVTVVSRGASGEPAPGVTWRRADRHDPAAIQPLAATGWDAVIDTWDGAPAAVEASAALLAGSAGWYGYVSSRSVYRWPPATGSDESAPVVEPDPDGGYPAHKRGAELAVLAHFEGRSMLARAGLIVGPYEDTGRLTWWLQRAAAGGSMVAPEPADRVWQLLDARDLAAFMLDAATAPTATTGVFNVVCSRDEGVTTGRLIEACLEVTGRHAVPVWVSEDVLQRAGVAEWDGLPGWIPGGSEAAGMHDCDVSAAQAAGLRCRPIETTVADTWDWLQTLPAASRGLVRAGLPRRGLSAEQEQAIWWLNPTGG
jgi:nucleoside-diphosphate-sugar epimerase